MSFKREGDDKGLLDNLRRRRVKELLGEDIPEDEAKLLCNGRFACLVCNHNPVFDTVNMLRVHRQGKKHAANEEGFLRKKKELKALILKRKHEQYMKDGTTTIKQAAAASSGGIMPVRVQPYDPRVKKHKVKPYDRKPCLDLHSDPLCSQSQPQSSVSRAVSDLHVLSTVVPKKHVHQLKNIFRPKQKNQGPMTPYVRQHRSSTDSVSYHYEPVHSIHSVPSNDHSVPQTGTFVDSKHSESLSSTTSSSLSSHCGFANPHATSLGLNHSSDSASLSAGTSAQAKFKCSDKSVHSAGVGHQKCGKFCTVYRVEGTGVPCGPSVSHPVGSVDNPGAGVAESSSAADVTEKKRLAQQYYHLSGSGWKKDWDGKWIRDEEAEFDSDEEPPDLP